MRGSLPQQGQQGALLCCFAPPGDCLHLFIPQMGGQSVSPQSDGVDRPQTDKYKHEEAGAAKVREEHGLGAGPGSAGDPQEEGPGGCSLQEPRGRGRGRGWGQGWNSSSLSAPQRLLRSACGVTASPSSGPPSAASFPISHHCVPCVQLGACHMDSVNVCPVNEGQMDSRLRSPASGPRTTQMGAFCICRGPLDLKGSQADSSRAWYSRGIEIVARLSGGTSRGQPCPSAWLNL